MTPADLGIASATLNNMNRDEFLTMREQLMENIDTIIDGFFYEFYGEDGDTEIRDELVTRLCDSVCETMDPAGLS